MLIEQTQRTTASLDFQQLIRSYVEHITGRQACTPLKTGIHAGDQMLLHSLNHHQNSDTALSQYFAISLQQFYSVHQILSAFFDPADPSIKVLDFACGFGRLLRLLTTQISPNQIFASEIQTDAVDYVSGQFGVNGLLSCANPDDFNPSERFDFIWVASLFSHLPERLFHAWIEKLTSLLTPQGVLCASIRDSALLAPDQRMPESGILYFSVSETTPLAEDIYGTTYVNEAFVASSISKALGEAHPYFRLKKSLAHEQDLYVVAAQKDRDLSALEQFRRGAWGWVDLCSYINGVLRLEGWAASLDDGVLQEVTVYIDGVPMNCTVGSLRRDVADAFADDRLAFSGWGITVELGHRDKAVSVLVEARSKKQERALLFTGKLD